MSVKLLRFILDLAAKAERLEVPQAVADEFGPYRDDPVGFCREALGVESALRRSDGEPYQFSVLADLVTEPRVAVRSGHGVGKTAIDAWAALWWLLTRPFSRVLVLAPEFARQVRAIVFSEIRRWARRARVPLPVEVLANRVRVAGHGEEWSATGMSAAGESDRLEGFHAPGGVLLICDETKGIPQDSFDAVQGALSGLEDSRLLVTSVPGGAGAGPFWKACQDARRWRIHHVPATDSSLVSPEWVSDRAVDWGVGSPLYTCRVLGEFADAGEGVLYPLSLLEAATSRVIAPSPQDVVALGVDVARSVAGDQNAVAIMRGQRLERVALWRSPDLMVTVQRVLEHATTSGAKVIACDVGGVGAGAVDRLRQVGRPVDGVAFGGAATDPTRFLNRRAELYWTLREALERGRLALPEDDELVADLSAIRYGFDQRGRIVLESKDDVRARLGRSPDRADAVVLASWAATGDVPGAGWFQVLDHYDRHLRPLHGVECGVCHPGCAHEPVVTITPAGGDPAPPATCPACGSARWAGEATNLTDTTVWWRCAACGYQALFAVARPAPAPSHLPPMFPAPAPEPPAVRMLSCGRCGTMMDFTPPADGGRTRCP